jgi:hypothetical protein
MGGVSFHPGGNRALVEVNFQPKGYAAFLIYTLLDRTSSSLPRCAATALVAFATPEKR